MATGRTVSKYFDFIIDDSGSTLRSIPVTTISGLGVIYDNFDVTAMQDAAKGGLPGQANIEIAISGPLDNTAAASVGTLSGSHTILEPLNGLLTPLTLDAQVGVQAAWSSGDMQFGITATSANGFILIEYTVNPDSMTYDAKFILFPGSALPAWGTAAET